MLQSALERREAYGLEPVNVSAKTAVRDADRKAFYRNPARANVRPFPLNRRRYATLLLKKLTAQLLYNERLRRQITRSALLILPVVLVGAIVMTLLLNAGLQALASANTAPQTTTASSSWIESSRLLHATVHVPLD